jgi:hypothetical protein
VDEPIGPPPPPRVDAPAPASRPPAWWQHWQVVVVLVVAAFAVGTAAGLATWTALDGGDPAQPTVAEAADTAGDLSAFLRDWDSANSGTEAVPLPGAEPLPEAELTVAADGCGVIRSGPAGEPRGLQWRVLDGEGFQVLGRNALGETRYRYFRPGTYTVVLVAWDGQKYAPISNEVTIDC